MNIYCLFPKLKNIDLIKEVGSIPYHLSKEYNHDTRIICFNNEEFPLLNQLKGLKLDIINKKYKIDIFNYIILVLHIIKYSKKIDVLICFHYTIPTLIYFFIYKLFNRKGICELTLDPNYKNVLEITENKKGIKYTFKSRFARFIVKYLIDIITVETKKAYDLFIEYDDIYVKKLMYMPIFLNINPTIDCEKKNQIISVGRIGTYQKASEIVLKSFKQAIEKTNNKKWILKMVGPISDDFYPFIEKFFNENPVLKDYIVFTGNISNRDELFKIFAQSKIFCLPSRFGSFEIVFAEALYYSNYLLISDVGIGEYLVNISNFGEIVEIDNIDDISNKLEKAMKNYENYLKNNHTDFRKLIKDEFYYAKYIEELNNKFNEIKNSK